MQPLKRRVWALLATAFLLGFSLSARAMPVVSELMASNSATIVDQDGDFADWVELYNPDPAPAPLAGWFLTNSATNPNKWKIPAVTLPPGGYIVIFCSGKNYADVTQPLATNFSLTDTGGYVALVEADGKTVASSINFPTQTPDISYGVSQPTSSTETPQVGYLAVPTPGNSNGNFTNILLADRVSVSVAPGLFTGTKTINLSGAAGTERIRYELVAPSPSGDAVPAPTAASTLYTGAFTISSTTLLRAAVFAADDSQHGLPTSAMYTQVDNTTSNRLDTFTSNMPLVVFDDNGFGPLPNNRIFYPAWIGAFSVSTKGTTAVTQTPDFFVPDTMKDHGFSSANWPKQSYESSLATDLGVAAPRTFLGLSSDKNWDSISCWSVDLTYIHNSFFYSIVRSMGYWAPNTKLVEMFIHSGGGPLDYSSYAGVTNMTERIKVASSRVNIYSLATTDVTAPNLTGGYIVKIDHPEDATRYFNFTTTQNTLVMLETPSMANLVKPQKDYITNYVQQMENAMVADQASGYATRNYLNFLDRGSWVDYHLMEVFAKNDDAFIYSEYFTKDINGLLKAGPVWDCDRAMGSADGRDLDPTGWNPLNVDDYWNMAWWKYITHDPDFMQAWIDRWQSLRLTTLSTQNLLTLIDTTAANIGPTAAARDAARWPANVSRFPGGWTGEIANMKSWIATRAQWIDAQFVPAPTVTTAGSSVTLTPPTGAKLAYTLDGSDPRLSGGAPSTGTVLSSGPVTLSIAQSYSARSYNPTLVKVYPGSPWSSPLSGIRSALNTTGQFINVSCRNFVGTGANVLVGGLVITGPAGVAKDVLIRGVGPTLAQYGVTGVLAQPVLSVYDSSNKLIATNAGWGNNTNASVIQSTSVAVGAFALPEGSADSALLLSLVPGSYTVQVNGVANSTGNGLVEVYQVSQNGTQFVNVSSRAQVSAATGGTLISGFVISGGTAQVLVRADGPALAAFNVPGVLAQPMLQVYDSTGKLLATNTGWSTNANAASIASAASTVGAFALTPGSNDCALLLSLPAGAYTMQISGVGNTTGAALAECYLVPSSP
jgi:hypothetical protein